MKATGIVRRIDYMGRVAIPNVIRRANGLMEGDPIEIFTEDGQIILRKYNVGTSYADQLDRILEGLEDEEYIPSEKREQAWVLVRQAQDLLKGGERERG